MQTDTRVLQTYTLEFFPDIVQDIVLYIETRGPTMDARFAKALYALKDQLEGRPVERPGHWRQWMMSDRHHGRHVDKIEARHP